VAEFTLAPALALRASAGIGGHAPTQTQVSERRQFAKQNTPECAWRNAPARHSVTWRTTSVLA